MDIHGLRADQRLSKFKELLIRNASLTPGSVILDIALIAMLMFTLCPDKISENKSTRQPSLASKDTMPLKKRVSSFLLVSLEKSV